MESTRRNGDPVFLHIQDDSEFGHFLRHDSAAVAFLEAKTACAGENSTMTKGGSDKEHRRQIRTVGQVQLRGSFGQSVEIIPVYPVSLQAVRPETGHRHIPAGIIEGFKESGVGVVTLHNCILGTESGAAGDIQGELIRPGYLYTRILQGLQGEGQIGAAFHGRQEPDPAVTGKQGQGKKQAGNELAGDASGNGILSGGQAALYQESVFAVLQAEPLFPAQVFIDRKRPGQKRFAAFQPHGLTGKETQGNHKTQGAAGFPAAKCRGNSLPGIAAPDVDGIPLPGEGSPQRGQAVRRGENILAGIHAPHCAFSFRQGGADQQAVSHGFGRRCRHRAPGCAGLNDCSHWSTPVR